MTTHTLTAADSDLARHLAETLAKAGEYGPTIEDFDAAQAGDGFTFDLGRNRATGARAGLHNQDNNWQRYTGYHAEDWAAVRIRVAQLLRDPEFLDSLGA